MGWNGRESTSLCIIVGGEVSIGARREEDEFRDYLDLWGVFRRACVREEYETVEGGGELEESFITIDMLAYKRGWEVNGCNKD